jgi:hypothetical protein
MLIFSHICQPQGDFACARNMKSQNQTLDLTDNLTYKPQGEKLYCPELLRVEVMAASLLQVEAYLLITATHVNIRFLVFFAPLQYRLRSSLTVHPPPGTKSLLPAMSLFYSVLGSMLQKCAVFNAHVNIIMVDN